MHTSNFERGTVVISIDDGDADGFRVYENVLKKYQLSATYNIVTSLIGDVDRLTREQLEILYNDPLIEIAAHGHTHENDDEDVSKSVECLYEWLDIKKDAIGFASPGSKMRNDYIEANAERLRSMKLLYVRTGRNSNPNPEQLAFRDALIGQEASEFLYKNAPQLCYSFDGLCVNSVSIVHQRSVEDIKKLVEFAAEKSACVVLTFHRFKKPGEENYEGKWCYDYDSFAEFAEYLSQMREAGKIDVLTNEQAYLLGRTQE